MALYGRPKKGKDYKLNMT